ncbi:Gamma-glutamylputrescine oxidoreductase [Pseudovibrio sp. Ad13]|uniref:NAD(P)/FAD-dependent oxidoreductase n=1 Tax=Pseudovibrio sp. Ad13 TaxID=989396 RepID=UPI0007AE5EDA|nr:FAD-binding oxidoreductase [Pseudovibrio sp. Ad13]KZK82349.1 Gamma-glutamylputrescine oxidoreductase [Pseudovibrio sp. Ad13]
MSLHRIFQEDAYGEQPVAENFWHRSLSPQALGAPLSDEQSCEVAVVGGGYTGLSAALKLAQQGVDVAVLDAQHIGWGASGRNGGFCCLGGTITDDADLIDRYGEADARRYFYAERAAIDLVAELLEQNSIDADVVSKGETVLAHKARRVDQLKDTAADVQKRYGISCTFHDKDELAELGMMASGLSSGLTIPIGFALHPYKYARGLAETVKAQGGRFYEQTSVLGITPAADGQYVLKARTGQLRAQKVLLATNGYSSENMPEWMAGKYLPVQSNILMSRVLSDEELKRQGWFSNQMAYDTRTLLHYFRLLPDNRMLFGMRGSVSATPHARKRMRTATRRDLERMFPEWVNVETPDFWSGLACLTHKLVPFAGAVPDTQGLYAAFGYHGNGIAMATYAGQLVAAEMLGAATKMPYPSFMKQAPIEFPFRTMRRHLLALSYTWFELKDRLL